MYFDNEERIVQENERRSENIERNMALSDSQTFDISFFDSKEYERLLLEMAKSKKITEHNPDLKLASRNEIVSAGREFISKVTENINTKMPYINVEANDHTIQDFAYETGDFEIDDCNYLDYARYVLRKSKKIEIIKMPVTFLVGEEKNGWQSTFAHKFDKVSTKLLRKIPFVCCGIELQNENTELSFKTLVHEYTHALVNRHKGIIENYAHNELLSIFMELVAAYEKEENPMLIECAITERLEDIRDAMLLEKYESLQGFIADTKSIYIDSALYAMDLFEMYKSATNKGKKAILNEIKKTLAGDRTLEDTLEKLGASEERGSQIMRTQVKTLLK